MEELKLYRCEFCGTSYKEKKRCIECEKSHKKPVKIIDSRYVAENDNKKGYPVSITVQMEDGNKVIYKR